MSVIQINTAFNIDIEFEAAEFHKRLLAYLVDMGILFLYLISMQQVLFGNADRDEIAGSGTGFTSLVLLLPMLSYTFLTELLMNGQTIGKKIMKIKVVSLDGGEATLGQYLLRAFLRFYEWGTIIYYVFYSIESTGAIFILFLGGITTIICIAITQKNQRLGDLAAGTVVVNTSTSLTVEDTVFMEVNTVDHKVAFPDVMRLSDRDINTIKNVLTQAGKRNNYEMCNRVAMKVKEVLKISTDMHSDQFLEKLLEDYNYLATKE